MLKFLGIGTQSTTTHVSKKSLANFQWHWYTFKHLKNSVCNENHFKIIIKSRSKIGFYFPIKHIWYVHDKFLFIRSMYNSLLIFLHHKKALLLPLFCVTLFNFTSSRDKNVNFARQKGVHFIACFPFSSCYTFQHLSFSISWHKLPITPFLYSIIIIITLIPSIS